MGFYATHVLPRLVDAACGMGRIAERRSSIVPRAEGVVLDVAIGSGHNLALYDPARVSRVIGLEPSEAMRRLAGPRARGLPFPVEFLDAPAERIPLDDRSVDTVVLPPSRLRCCASAIAPEGGDNVTAVAVFE